MSLCLLLVDCIFKQYSRLFIIRGPVKVIWDCSASVGGKWPLLCLLCSAPKWGEQGAYRWGGWSSTFLGPEGFQVSSFLAPSSTLGKQKLLVSLNTAEVLLFILQHQVGAAHGKQVSEGAFSVTHHTRLPPQLLCLDVFYS